MNPLRGLEDFLEWKKRAASKQQNVSSWKQNTGKKRISKSFNQTDQESEASETAELQEFWQSVAVIAFVLKC